MSISVTFLGGLGEIGRNCAAIEIDGKLALIDCGLMFPEEDMLGVDLVLPDFAWMIDRADDVECVILTHGHEDHVGALSYFLAEINVPVYGTELTVNLAASRLEENRIDAKLHAMEDNEWREVGPFRFKLVPVSHSIPQGSGVAFDTDEGIIVHSGDFKLDPTPIDNRPTDLPTFAELGREGVRLLLADSTNAEVPGFVSSESSLGRNLYDIIAAAEGRVVAACFASHIHRVQQIVDAALADGRKIAFLGRSMLRNMEIGRDLNIVDVPDDQVIPIDQVSNHDPSRTIVICTGSQGEPFAALSLMAAGEHRNVKIGDGDTVLISATPIPGNEKKVSRVINGLLKTGADVVHGRNAKVHVSGHAAESELLTFLNVVRPQAFVPVHGEYRMLRAHAALAEAMDVADVFVCEDGDRIVVDGNKTFVERRAVPAGYVYLDGSMVGDVKRAIRDRRHLADEGVVVITVGVDSTTGEIVYGPDLDSHGLMDQPAEMLAMVAREVEKAIASGNPDPDAVRRHVYETARRIIKSETRLRPVVLPVVIEF
ncbi:MAG: ribonuclease J [Acidimicrobiia bacterium]|nr:ribonuclease J [Acidimicrobiia bacterium]